MTQANLNVEELTIDINSACNHDCAFCYAAYCQGQLSYDAFTAAVDQHPNAPTVNIGGGEPMLHKDLPAMVQYVLSQGRRAHIATNGTIVPPGLLAFTSGQRQDISIQVSQHASTPELHKHITKRGTFHRVIENLAVFKEHFPTVLSCAIYPDNLADVPGLISLARQHGIPLRVNLAFAAGKGRESARLRPGQVQELTDLLLVEHLRGGVDSPLIHPNNCIALQRDYGIAKTLDCAVDGGRKAYIRPDGSRHACEWLAVPATGEPAPRYEVS